MSNPSSSAPKANNSTPAAQAAAAPAAGSKSPNPYQVPTIPAFNYAAAARKSKPSPAAVSGQDATGVLNGSTAGGSVSAIAAAGQGSQPTSPVVQHQKKPSVQVDGVRVPPSRVDQVREAAGSSVNFGTTGDQSVTLSSSPAAPPAVNAGAPKSFGSLAAQAPTEGAPAAAAKAPINLHSFFTGGGAPSSSASPVLVSQPNERRSVATFDPSASRSPGPSTSPLPPHPGHLGAPNTASFIPRSNNMPPPFVPGGQQAFSPPGQTFYPSAQPFIPKGPSPQNIPNGNNPSSYGGPGAPSSHGSRNGSFVGSPVLSGGVQRPQQQGRPSFGGPTSPRMPSAQLGQQPMMYGQGYGAPNPYAPYNPYAQQPYQGYSPAFLSQSQGPPPLSASGASTPSTGLHTPKPNVPASPSISQSFAPNSSYSPQPQNAALPRNSAAVPVFQPATPLRVASEFRPNGLAEVFTPSPRKSAAIKIVNPKDRTPEPKKEEAKAAEPEKVEEKPVVAEEKKVEESKVDEEKEKKEKEAAEAKKAEEQAAREEKAKKEAEAAEEQAKLDQEAADAKAQVAADTKAKAEEAAAAEPASPKPVAVKELAAEETASTDVSTPGTPGEEIAGLHVRSSEAEAVRQEEAVLLADEKIALEQQDPAAALVEARQALNAANTPSDPTASVPPTPSTSTLPSFLPAKPAAAAAAADPTAANATASTSAAPSSAQIAAASPISDLSSVSYPEGINSPVSGLNIDAEPGKYRYDREFLMQFLTVCNAKPDSLPNLADIGMVADDNSGARGAFGSGARRGGPMGPPAVPSRQASGMGSFGRSASAGGAGGFSMGNFGQGGPAVGMTSEQRFQASLSRSQSGAFGGQRGNMSRTTSQSGAMGGAFQQGGRTKSERGSKRGNDRGGQKERDESRKPGQHVAGDGFEGATLAARSETGWAPSVLAGGANKDVDQNAPEIVQRKVKALLNKLTLEKFDSISDQILEWANRSIDETDGRILRQVIALIFEKATDEATWSEMYARLCRKLMEKVSSDVRDETVKTADGTPVAGGALFRKYLLNRCQEDYENGWKNKEAAAAAAKSKEADDKVKQDANEAAKKEAEESGKELQEEAALLSEEYYTAQKAKRRGLGLVRFIGELYRLQMLTERIMHECIKKLLANTESPEEEDVESLCRLLTTVGGFLDNAKAKQHMDVYFSRMKTIADSPKVSSRIRFMILDVVDLRLAKWQSKTAAAGPKTISEIHADAQKQAEESARRVQSSGGKLPRLGDQLSRPNSRRGQGRDQFGVAQTGADGWTTQPQRPAKAGDLSSFGRIRDTSASSISLGPSGGAFANRGRKAPAAVKEESRPSTPINPFALLSGESDEPSAPAPERKRLQLKPRTVPLEGEEEKAEEETKEEEEDEDDGAIDPNASSLSRSEAERKAKNSVTEFFSVKNVSEAVASVEDLPKEYRHLLITAIAESALTRKADLVNLTRDLFKAVAEKNVLTHEQFISSFEPLFKTIVDTAIDAPGAYGFLSSLLLGAGISKEETDELATKMESEEGEEEVEYGKEAFFKAYEKIVAAPSA